MSAAASPLSDQVMPRGGIAPIPLPRGRRGTELAMIGFAVVIMAFAWASSGFGLNGHIPPGLITYVGGFAVLLLGAHVAVRFLAPWADPLMLPLAGLLNGLGVVMIYRLQESGRGKNPGLEISTLTAHAALIQLMYTAIGLIGFVIVLAVIREPRILQRYTYTLGTLGLIVLAIPAVLPDRFSDVNGAKVWITVGGFSIQPGEFARIALAVFFAGYLVRKREVLALAGRRFAGIDFPRARDLGPVAVIWLASLLVLVFESDIGTSALFFGMFIVMIYLATQRTSWMIIGILLFVGGATIAQEFIPHVHERFEVWLHPFAQALGSGYQVVQGLEGMAFGGLFGTGLGQGEPYHTPLVQSDFILTGFGEELGLTGLMALVLIYALITQRGLRAGVAVKDPFSKLLAGGLSFILALQVFIILGGVSNLIPLTGITTPFLSQGGSSLIASWIVIALLMRVSDTARRPAPQPIQDEGLTQVVRAG
ncbi:MAG TPA: FtsW/RodA/SpoVE family cell cycle protein [Streptosporangiaceae bacterium]|jgi:cell division protein FtsW (lipid II flippase)|nr:FtsW/RodA/SpoVE family cell cycle protein [Streptosporangiaceae bacterium]